MVRAWIILFVLGLLSLAPAQADEPIFSGPQIGEKLTPFKVQWAYGPAAGKEVELIGELKGATTVLVFVHELTRPASQLLRPIDRYGRKMAGEGLATQFVWLTADKGKTAEFLRFAKNSISIESPVSISPDGLEGPGNYGLNRKVTLTILVAKDNKVVANFAIVQPNETDAPKVLAPIAKLLGKPAPTLEELRETKTAEPKRGEPPAELTGLMRRMIQLTNDADTVKEIAAAMQKWAGDDAGKKAVLTAYCKRVVGLGYGNDLAKAALKRLAGE